ncbi:MAG TPA: glycosyltransferase [Candidatus Hydrogenedentes bacterium]|nr:glycosyltransferase [Candidatus Hydrogenedentota bacterium]
MPPDAFVLGIVARMQTHRHYEDLFDAFARLAAENPRAHLVVVGRGTNQETVGFEPVRRLGLADRVHFTGYIAGEDYVGMLRAFDAGVLLVPGSDGTCRAVREVLAMGRPMVVADRGMLAEIVADGQTGLVCDGTPDGLHAAFAALAADRARRAALGRNARAAAEARHALPVQAAQVLSLYERVLHRTATA